MSLGTVTILNKAEVKVKQLTAQAQAFIVDNVCFYILRLYCLFCTIIL